ncbi:MAG TPA: lytic murein transglycosylase [Solirubrobacteraceae bacterium]|nr:lytic murein transglycosylase [Solirubrobacteraceae bacterium]
MAQTQPALPFVHLVVERFDYERVGGEWGEWAALRLLAGLGTETITPSAAYIVVECDATGDSVYAAATSSSVERRLRTDGPAEFEALWSATFSVPLEVVEAPAALFKLIAGERRPVAVALPVPQLSHIGHPVLSLTELRRRHHETMRRRTIGSARQLAAVATSVAVTATSVPTAALATQLTTPSATPAPTAAPLTTSTPAPTTTTATTTAPATPGPSVAAAASAGAPAPVRQRSSRHSTKLHQKRTHRIASPSTASHRSVTSTTRAPSGCATTDTAGPTAYAATGHTATSAHARHVTCHTRPASGPTSPPLGAALSFGTPGSATSTTQNPAPTSTPRPGKPTPTPPSHHPAPGHAAQPAHHGGTHSSSTGGVAPAAPSRPVHSSTPSSSPAPVSALSSTPAGFSGPKSWTGTVAANPALTGAVTELSGLLSNGNRPPSFLIPVYMEAGKRYDVPWEVLASINAIESDYGRNLNTSSAGAVGWMQFEPSTWSQYGMAVDGHSVPNPYDPRDAIFSAARYLAAAGAAQDVPKAVFAYNHASWYVDEVMSRAKAIAGHVQYESSTLRHGVFAVSFATGQKTAPKIRYTSGVLSHYDRLISAANMVSAANFPYVWGGGHTQPSQFAPFDCSGSVSYVIQQAGYTVPTTVSGDIPVWKFPAGPGQVTIFYNPTHTFMRIGDRYFGTSGFARPGGGAGWFSVDKLPADYLAQFREVHVPNLGPDSFSGSEPPVVVTPLLKKHRHRNTTSTVRFWPLMSTLGVFPGASNQA